MNVCTSPVFVVVVAVNIFLTIKKKLFVTPPPWGFLGAAAVSSLSFGPRVMKGCVPRGLSKPIGGMLHIGYPFALLPLQRPPPPCLFGKRHLLNLQPKAGLETASHSERLFPICFLNELSIWSPILLCMS